MSNSTSAWNICENKLSNTTLQSNKDYWCKIEFNGSNLYTMSLSTDGNNFTQEATVTSTAQLASYTGCIGVDYHGSNKVMQLPFQGTIDLGESYILYLNPENHEDFAVFGAIMHYATFLKIKVILNIIKPMT